MASDHLQTRYDKRFVAAGRYVFGRLVLGIVPGVLLLWANWVCAEPAELQSESQVKAAFLFKFTGYVTWPANAFEQQDAPLVMCVIEADDVANEVARLGAGRLVNTHPIVLRRLNAADALTACHVLFVGSAASSRLGKIISATRVQSVLTVTELDDALSFGSVINFIVVDEQVRFDVSLPAAERGNVKISARLLAVARQVIPLGAP